MASFRVPSAIAPSQAQPRLVTLPAVGGPKRFLEVCQPGRIAPPTWAVAAASFTDEDRKLSEELRQIVAPNDTLGGSTTLLHNQSGLNGLATSGTSGLDSGVFQVSAAQPVNYVIEEMEDLFNLDNESLMRGVVPDSFPSRLSDGPMPGHNQRRFIVIDDNVHRIHGARIENYFKTKGVEIKMVALPTREANKDFELVYKIARELEAFGLNRRKEPMIAIGGGVCLDVAGLTANLYRRNTPIIKIPTTLMAAIDASIGIKTAVNFENKKNKLGTYCPPLAVFIDRTFLKTVDQRNLSNGAAEMLKMACVKDAELFYMLEEYSEHFVNDKFQGPIAGAAMRRSVQGMLEELEYNLWEHILCRLVDYGHTFSPELEMAALVSNDELLHGEAVNIDMALTTQLAYARGMISLEQRNRVYKVMHSLQLPFWHHTCSAELFYKGLKDTTKARDGHQRVPLMDGIGAAEFVNDLTMQELKSAASVLRTIAEANTGVGPSPHMISSVVPKWPSSIKTPVPV